MRFETAVAALAPDLAVLAPVRDWGMTREQEIAYAEQHGIEVPVKRGAAYSIDQNLWGRSIEAGPLEDPWMAPPEEAYALTLAPERALPRAAGGRDHVRGRRPVAVDGEELGLVELIARAAALAGAHGVGRIDMIENRLVGIKSREVYETPAAALLLRGLRGRRGARLRPRPGPHEGRAGRALRDARLQRPLVLAASRARSTRSWPRRPPPSRATARVKLYRGSCAIVGRRADSALYDHGLATYEHGDSFQHGAAAGFIHIWSLPTKTWAAAADRSRETAPA